MTDPTPDPLSSAHRLRQSGDIAGAHALYRQAAEAAPDDAQAWFFAGATALQLGRGTDALALLTRAVTIDPGLARAHNALGILHHAEGRPEVAAAALRTAVAADPGLIEARHNLARVLGEGAESEAILAAIIAEQPDNAAALCDLGALLRKGNKPKQAEDHLHRALALRPGLPEAEINLALIHALEGRDGDARSLLATARDPLARFLSSVTTPAVLADAAQADAIEARFLAALDAAPALPREPLTALGAMPHFYFAYWDRPLRTIHERTASVYRRLCPSLAAVAPHCRRPAAPRSRPRVAVVSSHWDNHTIQRLFAGLVGALAARPDFEVIAVAAQNSTGEALTVPVVRLPGDLAAARTIVADLAADVILYTDIGMEPFTYFLAHARLAPLQLVTWGHPVTPGLDTIDAFLSADYLDTPEADSDHTERLIRLPAPAYHFARPEIPAQDRSHYGLPASDRLYVCPQTLFKFHPSFDDLIAGVLRADPTGHVVLLRGAFPTIRAALETRFKTVLPDVADRILFLPPLPRADFLGLLRLADVMLDIPTFAGGNTTLEGLAAGTPVITMARTSHLRGRLTAGLLRLAGLEQGIAASPEDYIARAVDFAHDGAAARRAIADQAGVLYERPQAAADLADALHRLLEQA